MTRQGTRYELPNLTLSAESLAWMNDGRSAGDRIRDFINAGEGLQLHAPGYESLAGVLRRAFDQAARGKGAERHAQELPFHQQPMQRLCQLYGVGFALGQAGKKMQEAQRLPRDAAIRELLGAINYAAGAVIYLESRADG